MSRYLTLIPELKNTKTQGPCLKIKSVSIIHLCKIDFSFVRNHIS